MMTWFDKRLWQGQSTLEYVLVFCGLMSMVIALGVMYRALSSGVFTHVVQEHSSHDLARAMLDILLY